MASEEQLQRLKFSREPARLGNGRVIAGVVFGLALGIGLAFALGFGSSNSRNSYEASANEIDSSQQGATVDPLPASLPALHTGRVQQVLAHVGGLGSYIR